MKDHPHGKKAIAGIVVGTVLFWLRTALVMEYHSEKLGSLLFIFPYVNLAGSLMMAASAWGIYKRAHWAGGKFFLPFVASIGGMVSGFFLLLESNWLFGLVVPVEFACFIFALYHLVKIPREEWKERRKGLKGLLRWDMLVSAFFYLILFEMGLNLIGFQPDRIFPSRYFKEVEELVLWEDYYADEKGITKINPDGRALAATGAWKGVPVKNYHQNLPFSPSTYSLFEDNRLLLADSVDNPFSHFLDSLLAVPDSLLDPVGRAYLDYRLHPVNAEGFRSLPFQRFDSSNRKKVLLIGDSFTFGWSARPWTNAFADCLSSMGYIVYNAGITATDPSQYLAVADKYIPMLQPDAVVVNVFLGNDVVYYPHTPRSGEPFYYPTNAGVMMAEPGCERLPSPDSAYRFYRDEYFVLHKKGLLNQLAGKTSIGMLGWKVMAKLGLETGRNTSYWRRNRDCRAEKPLTEGYLKKIQELARAQGTDFLCGVIPDMGNLNPDLEKDYPGLFTDLPVALPPVDISHYNEEEQHFNPAGHAFYARFLHGLLDPKTKQGTP